ncbi:MFS transporter [Methanobrevibacter filiformis]|uniref:Multidrug efflux protein YfmO n=1 Tax=Methanobrevibacter filiformis TaxID=55758 RepID=A0A166CGX6_9EURY|nr:MFS transporter [Methanobrevibacter filiformis]KZX14217.1 multidrug efflux protein YfmO [Methanobrevibacter filiformis]
MGSSFKSNFNQTKAVWAVFFAAIIAFMGLGLVDPILPVISQQLGASQTEVALLFTGYSAVMAIAMLVTGAISTRLGIKKTLILGVAIIAVFSTLSGFSDNVWTIILLRCAWGFGNALFVAVALNAIVSFSNNQTHTTIILYETAVGLGFSIGPLAGGLLGNMSWKFPFFGVGILMVLGLILLAILIPGSKKTNENNNSNNKEEEGGKSLLDPFRAMKHKHISVLSIFAFLYNFGFFTLFAYSPFVLGLDAQGIGFVFLGWGILLAISSIFMAPKIRDRFGTFNSIYYVLSLFVVLLFIMGIFTSVQWIMIIAIITSGILIGNNNTLLTTAILHASDVDKSTTSAAYNFVRFIGSAIAPLLAAFLGEHFFPSIPFLVGGIFVLTAIIFLFVNRKYLPNVDVVESKFVETSLK